MSQNRLTIREIKERIRLKENNIFGWEMRIMQSREDLYFINKALDEHMEILLSHRNELTELKNLLANRRGVKK